MKRLLLPILLLAAAAGLGAYLWTRSQAGAPPAAGPGSAAGAAASTAAPAPAKKPPRVIPEVLPEFTLATLEGPPRALSSYKHPSLVINFWATWCAPCRREIPLLRQLRAERGARGVEVLGIAVDFREDVEKYVAKIGLDYPLLIGEEDGLAAADAFGIDPVFPFTVFADAQRRIVAVKVGELHADEAAFILDHIELLNAGRLPLREVQALIRAELQRLEAQRTEKPA
ncbi:MAG: TlpA family protein disulfide reductase [Gammaproteobacteria bacterium]|nr:TlpA family protein disulfide reductase [Gammaproteobacteria bacterium]